MNVTIAICTWNRAKLLDQTLCKMQRLTIPVGLRWEVLVVNNRCSDDTDTVIEKHLEHLPLRRLYEERQGQSHARNTAIEKASGELLIWTDDDVLVENDWVEQYLAAANGNPEAAFFGGTVLPWYESDPPKWLLRNMTRFEKVLAVRRQGSVVRSLLPSEKVTGANMAFRLKTIRQYAYDSRLSRIGSALAGCEDHELIDRMRADGHQGVWVGTAAVQHYIPKQRMTTSFARRWWREQARLYLRRFPQQIPSSSGVPPWLWRKYVQAASQELVFRIARGPRWAEAFFDAAWLRGMMDMCGSHVESKWSHGECAQ